VGSRLYVDVWSEWASLLVGGYNRLWKGLGVMRNKASNQVAQVNVECTLTRRLEGFQGSLPFLADAGAKLPLGRVARRLCSAKAVCDGELVVSPAVKIPTQKA
jgi:hypothetical protein